MKAETPRPGLVDRLWGDRRLRLAWVGTTAVLLLAHASLSLEAQGSRSGPRPVVAVSSPDDPGRVEGPLPPVVVRHARRGAWLGERGLVGGPDVPPGGQGRRPW